MPDLLSLYMPSDVTVVVIARLMSTMYYNKPSGCEWWLYKYALAE